MKSSHRLFTAGAALTLLLAGCNGASTSQLPAQTSNPGASSVQRFTPASQAEKQQPRPSITSRNVVYCSHGHNNCYRFSLVTSVAIDSSGAFSAVSPTCDDSIWDAPWVFADSNFTLPIAASTTMAACTSQRHGHEGEGGDLLQRDTVGTPTPVPTGTPSPTPVPTPTGSPSNLYIVKIDIGWNDLTVAAVAGPATVANGQWTFPQLAKDDAFADDHLYAFFVATFDGKGCPVPVASP